WKHPDKKSPEISSIHAICCSGFMVNRYNTYRDKVEKKHQLEGQVSPEDNSKMSAGNERLRFHGTGTYVSTLALGKVLVPEFVRKDAIVQIFKQVYVGSSVRSYVPLDSREQINSDGIEVA
ncbi:13875_t:CDS:2, partial [Entrophospora sp. SA101]